MKEAVYGWYPAAKSTWRTTNQSVNSYDKESLYRHWNSRYVDKPGIETPRGGSFSLEVRGTSPFAAQLAPSKREIQSGRGSRASSRASSRLSDKLRSPGYTPQQAWGITHPENAPLYEFDDQLSGIPEPVHLQGGHERPRSAASNHSHSSAASLRSRSSGASHRSHASVESIHSQGSVRSAHSAASQSSNEARLLQRARSAYIKRPSAEVVKRPVRSAGPRSPAVSQRASPQEQVDEVQDDPTEDVLNDAGSDHEVSDKASVADDHSEDGQAESAPLTDYQDVIKKYGWRAEVPGDPYNIKKPCLPPRLSYANKMPEPRIAANPPKAHMVNFDTFFSNTIPRKPLTFTIHKEWISEVLHAKRMELQKAQGGLPYKHTNYSFIY